jgi:hypothetical protein
MPLGLDLTGKLASELSLQLSADYGADGGVRMAPLKLYVVWTALQTSDAMGARVDGAWTLCDVPIAGLVDAPLKVVGSATTQTSNGRLSSTTDGATFTQPDVAVVIGAHLADPVNDPLPTDGSHPCADATQTGCVIPDSITHRPGAALLAEGLTPDVDLLYVDLRVKFALRGTATKEGTLDGTVTAASIESHVLACRLRQGGGDCTPAQVAAFEAMHPKLTIAGGTLRSHSQNFYFTCPQLLSDPQGSLSGIEPPDGGTPNDLGTDGGKAGAASFSTDIQRDLDARGCATGGCHESFVKPGQLHLVFQPATADELRRNWQAVLPSARDPSGGKLVNTAPLPEAMRERWLRWIAAGAPF